jgi:hypothetical protein
MGSEIPFDPLERFAGIERLAAKVYFRFSHLFLRHENLREFWWQMAMDEEKHASVLLACKTFIENIPREPMDPSINQQMADHFETQLQAYLSNGTQSITVEKAFRIALELETSELDVIYNNLLQSCGPKAAQTMAKFGVPANVHRVKLKAAILRFSMEPKLRAAAEEL